MSNKASPALQVSQIKDNILRTNFKNLIEYFAAQNQLLDFKFAELVFTEAVDSFPVAHNLPSIPRDVIVTHLSGAGSVTFPYGDFDADNIYVSSTDACRVRFFYGSYWDLLSSKSIDPTASQTFSPTTASSASSSGVPTGMIMAFAGATAPSGWLLCDGSEIDRTTYAALFAVIGTDYGIGNNRTTFNLPNPQGLFVRASGTQTISGVAYTGTRAAKQSDTTKKNGLALTDPGHVHNNGVAVPGDPVSNDKQQFVTTQVTAQTPNAAWIPWAGNFKGNTSTVATGASIGAGDAETRPGNISFPHYIKT